ncbi:hypothetical protein H2201_009361, partial [Coniosporium apollinis]
NANAHQKIDSTMAMGGTSHSGSVSSQPAANAADTQTAFHTLTAVAFLPCRVTPAYSRCPTWRSTSGMTKTAAIARPRMPDTGSRMATAMIGTR